MNRVNRIVSLITVTLASLAVTVDAQVDALLTQYYEVLNYYNAAAIGTTDYLRMRTGSRLQWTGAEPSPKSFMLTGDMPLPLLDNRLAAGVVVQRESIGLYRNTTAGLQAGYKIKTGKGSSVTLAIQAGMIDDEFRWSERAVGEDEASDSAEELLTDDVRHSAFDMSLGVFYSSRYFWGGVSVTHLTRPSAAVDVDGSGNDASVFNAGRKFYLVAGGNIPIKNTLFEIQPSMLLSAGQDCVTGELTARVRYNRFLSVGVAWRHDDAVALLLGAEFRNIFIGYSYDRATADVSRRGKGSHEVWGGYRVKLDFGPRNRYRYKSIRIM